MTSLVQEHLNRVSRSFAFCIEELQEPLKTHVGLAYLLCRIADTIEDSKWNSHEDQVQSFNEFLNILASPTVDEVRIRNWRSQFPQEIVKGESLLLDDAVQVVRQFWGLDDKIQNIILQSLVTMVRGMQHFSNGGTVKLSSLRETNEYCFFVAGVVGEMLTNLSLYNENFEGNKTQTLVDSFHFGLFLQKVNLLKDQQVDETQGRHFIVSREQILESLHHHAERAFQYIEAMPQRLHEYRVFCSWCLFLGLASLPYIQESFRKKANVKIPRLETLLFLNKVKSLVAKPSDLKQLFDEKLRQIFATESGATSSKSTQILTDQWPLAHLYSGQLRAPDFAHLGLTEVTL